MLQPLVESMEVEMAEMEVEVKALVISKNLLTGTKTLRVYLLLRINCKPYEKHVIDTH